MQFDSSCMGGGVKMQFDSSCMGGGGGEDAV